MDVKWCRYTLKDVKCLQIYFEGCEDVKCCRFTLKDVNCHRYTLKEIILHIPQHVLTDTEVNQSKHVNQRIHVYDTGCITRTDTNMYAIHDICICICMQYICEQCLAFTWHNTSYFHTLQITQGGGGVCVFIVSHGVFTVNEFRLHITDDILADKDVHLRVMPAPRHTAFWVETLLFTSLRAYTLLAGR